MIQRIIQPPPNFSDYEEMYHNFSWNAWHTEFSWYKTGKINYAYEITNYQVQKGNDDKPAIVTQKADGGIQQITFAALARRSTILAANLQQRGLKPGDRFGIYAPKSIDYVTILLAVIKCGAIAVPLFEAFGSDAVADRLNDCGATWLYVTPKLKDNVHLDVIPSLNKLLTNTPFDIPSQIHLFLTDTLLEGDDDPSTIIFGDLETPFIMHYTSGSTAKPKGILLANRAMIGHMVTSKYVLDLHPGDQYWNTGDPGWVTGMVYNFFAPLLLGIAAHIYEGPFQPMEWVNFMARTNISVWYSTPTAFRLLRYYNVPLNRTTVPTLRHIVSAGEPLNPELIDWTMANLGIPIHDSWYMTENGHQLINNYRCLPIKKGSMGKCLPGIYAAVIDEAGNEVPTGTIGCLAVRTPWPGLMKAVWHNPEKFRSYFQNDWYISGDVAYQDADGYFWFQGRDDDMIKSAAERISPFEIESTLLTHPAIAETGIIGKPHELLGTIIKAFVMLKPGFTASDYLKRDIMNHVKEKLAVHEVPREIEFVEKLPKTRSGKIMRRVLRSRETNEDAGDLSTMDVEMNPSKS